MAQKKTSPLLLSPRGERPGEGHSEHGEKRYQELDLLRSAAVAMMIVYHLVYDLAFFYAWDIDPLSGGWKILARSTASLFLLLVGISFAISWSRTPHYPKYFKRGLVIFGCGMLVTTATYLFDPATYVRFGILHMIGVSTFLLPLFARFRSWNAILGIAVLGSMFLLPDRTVDTSLLILLGMLPLGFSSVDYYPMIPWFGIVLIGLAIGSYGYVNHRNWRNYLPTEPLPKIVLWPSRHALVIYLVHQPILLFLLWVFH